MAGTNTYINEDRPIYISYAHNDERNPDIADVVPILLKKFKENGIDYSIDEDINCGGSISDFEHRIGKSEFVILVFSDKYFHSLYCMYELTQIRNGIQSGNIKQLLLIKSGNFQLSDPNYIDSLLRFWMYKKFERDVKPNTSSAIEQFAAVNNFYIESIRQLDLFFSSQPYPYYKADKLNFNQIIQGITHYFHTNTQTSATNLRDWYKNNYKDDQEINFLFNETTPIYISYSRKDSSNLVNDIVDKLKKDHFSVRFDKANNVGENITTFEKEIGNSEYTIMVYSNNFFKSPHCMYEYKEIIKCKKEGLICIKKGRINLKNINYIKKLKDYWRKYGINVFCKEFEDFHLTEIEAAAKENFFYKEDLKSLDYYFSKDEYLNGQKFEYNKLRQKLCSWFELDKVYYLKEDKNKQLSPEDIYRGIKTYSINKKTLIWKEGMENWCEAGSMPEFKAFFAKIPPQH